MRRYEERQQRRRMFQGTEMTRLMSMVLMLGVLLLIITRARDPDTWRWLVNDAKTGEAKPPQPLAAAGKSDQALQTLAVGKNGVPAEKPPAKPALQATGPTDQDPEEASFMKEALEAVTDLTVENTKEEMVAYERIVRWALNQPFDALDQRARQDLLFTQLVNAPADYRGQLIAVRLDVKRILPWELKTYDGSGRAGKDAKPTQAIPVYEAWGITPDSKAWPFLVILVDLPKGMPTGDAIDEKVRFAGYFFKVQKYFDGLHRADRAPVLIGRVDWQPSQTPGFQETDWYVTYGVAAAVLLLVVVTFLFTFFGRKRRSISASLASAAGAGATPIEEWFEQAEGGKAGDGKEPPADGDIVLGDAKSTGKAQGNGAPFPYGLDANRAPGE